ncbi:MAG: hypothetical protein Q8K57_13340 [Thiobacillus sp.]|nr:hypothetical protein [Thiobacillus sp.]
MSEKDKNRAAFPHSAALVDELREIFGADVKLEWAEENGRTIGKKGADGVMASPSMAAPEITQYGRRNGQ